MNKHLNSNRLCQFGLLLAIDSVSLCIRLTEECVALSCSCCCPEGHPDPAFVPCRLFSTFSIFSTACRCACKYLPFSVCPDWPVCRFVRKCDPPVCASVCQADWPKYDLLVGQWQTWPLTLLASSPSSSPHHFPHMMQSDFIISGEMSPIFYGFMIPVKNTFCKKNGPKQSIQPSAVT